MSRKERQSHSLKDALFRRMLERRQLTRRPTDDTPKPHLRQAPLSTAQQRLWFLEQLQPGAAGYNDCFGIRLEGPLDRVALQQSLRTLADRHQALRAEVVVVDGRPIQRTTDARFKFEEIDLRDHDKSCWQDAVNTSALALARQPFQLDEGPLVRFHLLYLQSGEHLLLIVVHHLVFDGQSFRILFSELATLYESAMSGQRPTLDPLAVDYFELAAREFEELSQADDLPGLDYWVSSLTPLPPRLQLPTDLSRPASPSYTGAGCETSLSNAEVTQLGALARKFDATLFMVLSAAYCLLLHAVGRTDDLLVGAPVANRLVPGSDRVIGMFVNTVLLRSRCRADQVFADYLADFRRTCLEAYGHQQTPFERVVSAVAPQSGLRRDPLVEAFVLEERLQPAINAAGLQMSHFPVDYGVVRFPLALWLMPVDSESINQDAIGLLLRLQYGTELFTEARIESLLRQYKHLLASLAEDPSLALDQLEVSRRQVEEQSTAIVRSLRKKNSAERLRNSSRQNLSSGSKYKGEFRG